jgi:hypothetical protein
MYLVELDVIILTLSEYLSVKGFPHFMLIWRYSRVVHATSSLRNRYNLPSAHPKKFPSIAKLENVPKLTPEAETE